METSSFRLHALLICCIAIAACSQTTELSRFQYTPSINSVPERGAGPLTYRVLHSFPADDTDGNYPIGGLVRVGDAFYGTTSGGGAFGDGTVFSITTGGSEKVLHSFGKGADGQYPYAGLVDMGGTLYGTTGYGGAHNYGTVFSITTEGMEKVLHSFGRGADGELPSENLIDVGGRLYGTTENGGTNYCGASNDGCGTVFSVTADGTERVLHSFGKGTDGRFAAASLTYANGTLFGTTIRGGRYYFGTVFSITTDGKEKVLHSFGKGSDGANPAYTSLIAVNGTLYGTTEGGGTHHNSGTVFRVTRAGSERVLHSFGEGTDGNFPAGGLIDVGGTIYGTTIGGGTNYCGPNADGCGTLYGVTTGGREKVLHNFGKGTDGNGPIDNLIYEGGSLFGVTQAGGVHSNPQVIGGTVFSLAP
jgi:uncharacterized repeat protein (TIGR03803 family)